MKFQFTSGDLSEKNENPELPTLDQVTVWAAEDKAILLFNNRYRSSCGGSDSAFTRVRLR